MDGLTGSPYDKPRTVRNRKLVIQHFDINNEEMQRNNELSSKRMIETLVHFLIIIFQLIFIIIYLFFISFIFYIPDLASLHPRTRVPKSLSPCPHPYFGDSQVFLLATPALPSCFCGFVAHSSTIIQCAMESQSKSSVSRAPFWILHRNCVNKGPIICRTMPKIYDHICPLSQVQHDIVNNHVMHGNDVKLRP